jgi:hypothetical protein
MRKTVGRQPFRRRIIAFAAAYAVALASLISSFSSASVAAEAAAQLNGILCHTDFSGQRAPSTDDTNNRICADCCCVGCLTLMAALPPPSLTAVATLKSSSERVAPLKNLVVANGVDNTAHRSRAPPLAA